MAVYYITDGERAKIGYTDRPISERLRELQTGNPQTLELVLCLKDGTFATEQAIHRNWQSDLIRGEWFRDSEALRDRFRDLFPVDF